ncbi:hypothetical protein COLO4_09059 [Corchorus olitorius]|uniref:Uncharacterized protein n=1 Tax=Corchorus olitorius TaxID=93759 RepID=A0A1R3KDF9_9ROSI|nr:hypothetical protein COLO4_09059 [Corchorus olitorius]
MIAGGLSNQNGPIGFNGDQCEINLSLFFAVSKSLARASDFPKPVERQRRRWKRRFSYGHLAQRKCLDEMTSCMKPDLHISIIFYAIECGDMGKSATIRIKGFPISDFRFYHGSS